MKKRHLAAILLASSAFISACGSPEEQIHKSLEETVVLEKDFEKQQKPLMKLEKEEKSLFDEMMNLGMKKFDEIVSLSDKALTNLDKREELLAKEEEAMAASKKEFDKIDGLIGKLKDDQLKGKAKELQELMNQRYDSHKQLVKAYNEAIKQDRKVYELMKDKELKLETLESQIESANQVQEDIQAANELFNKLTDQFNEGKEKLYKEAGIISD
ncbi:YkyA family protein [Siminovitchia terrae]|uniref:YkyA family protein n=1 Tax=Siminovitchia terrae TaxID=1914933 RepID=UPI0028AE46A9|nr:YkyA family protein [Siminovitchia terrae]